MPDSQPIKIDRETVQDDLVARPVRRLLAEVVADCKASESTLWLISADGQHMEGAINHGPTPQILERATVPVIDSVVGMVAANGMAVSIGPEDYHNPSVDQATGVVTQAMIAAPVYMGNDLVGVLSAINPAGGGLFESSMLDVLQWKAYLLGLILSDRNDEE